MFHKRLSNQLVLMPVKMSALDPVTLALPVQIDFIFFNFYRDVTKITVILSIILFIQYAHFSQIPVFKHFSNQRVPSCTLIFIYCSRD